ncbi:MAG: N-6 DNA methylase [Candidatus Poribacteria bacterium]|nr:N-6 DNA methylase [Candidatus Poribacteria bacterium]
MSYQTIINKYRQNIYSIQAEPNATAELSLHTYLQDFLEETADFLGHDVTIIHEPRKLDIGRPDFVVQDGLLHVGYVEAEAFETDLDRLTGHAKTQNDRFIENLDNFVLTNFVEFQLYTEGTLRAKASLTGTQENDEKLETLLDRFLGAHPISLATSEALANYLARRTRELRTQIERVLCDQQSETYSMFKAFQKLLLSTLTPDEFADMYAQTLTYGLFAARCTLPNGTNFSRQTANEILPRSNPFLRRLFHQIISPDLDSLDSNVTWILDDIASLLRNVPTEMLRTAFDAQTHIEDPTIHFYETFLKEYDAERRIDRGVYFTRSPIISYIVRSVDILLKTKLGKVDGLADNTAFVLDPATGTGGFLLETLRHIYQYITNTYGSGYWQQYVNGKLVKRLSGFEILIASYTIAHLKLSLFLQDQGWDPTDSERLPIYLTNTLEEAQEKETIPFAGFITEEANAAVKIKRETPILAIIGNPPWPRKSANPSRRKGSKLTFIGDLIEDYKWVDGKRFNSKENTQPLQADYVKFIRWAQWRIEKNGEGVIGYVVRDSFLNGEAFRGMRQSLINSFNIIYLFNMHGNPFAKEAVPDGEKDENVFEIQQGVSILLCVKKRDDLTPAKVYYADMWGTRKEKYQTLLDTDVQNTDWEKLRPKSPLYLFVPRRIEQKREKEYKKGWTISDIFSQGLTGLFTGQDKLAIQRTSELARNIVNDFVSLSETEIRQKHKLDQKDKKDWTVKAAQSDLKNLSTTEEHIKPICYRPFDTQFTCYTGKSSGFHNRPRPDIMRHLLAGDNLALCVCKIVTRSVWQHALVTNQITEKNYVSNGRSESGYVFPLYLYPDANELNLSSERPLNLKPEFLKALSKKLVLCQSFVAG